ncbi:MAG TPA: oligopeptide/dipeptide ABC transporter ATP-binding protein, partial [Chondromyces sp.]|nr:oligopeptide/dipeptide ABC transporter ATP-binding protein [Chondromyces sp.]
IVMYAGKVVEEADVHSLFKEPKHPYTIGLIQSVPDMREKKDRLFSIKGNVPKPGSIQSGCQFAPRCEHAHNRCFLQTPELEALSNGRKVRCWLYSNEEEQVI